MQVHKSLSPSLTQTLRRKLTFRRKLDANNNPHRVPPPRAYHGIDMSSRVDWAALDDAVLDQPATNPPRTMLLVEVPEFQSSCVTHGERVFKVERHGETVRVRDVLHALDAFLHRRVPNSVGSFARPEEMKKVHVLPIVTHLRHPSESESSSSASDESSASTKTMQRRLSLPLPLPVHDCGAPPVVVSLPVGADSPDRSNSTLESSASGGGGAGNTGDESVLSRWLGEKRILASIKRAENHDFKLIARMENINVHAH